MTIYTPAQISDIPNDANFGHVYAVGFDDGTVKVGSTSKPQRRVQCHRMAGGGFGIGLTDIWVSSDHRWYLEGERFLIAETKALGGLARGREWFGAVAFADVATLAIRWQSHVDRKEAKEAVEGADFDAQLSEYCRREQEWDDLLSSIYSALEGPA